MNVIPGYKDRVKTMYREIPIYKNFTNGLQIILPGKYGSYVGTLSGLKGVIDRYYEAEAKALTKT